MNEATRLRWQKMREGVFLALCGEEGQGRAEVVFNGVGWSWRLDMLPGDSEPVIVGAGQRSAFDAMAEAQKQVDAWPSLIEGARRV